VGLLAVYAWAEPRLGRRIQRLTLPAQLALAVLVPLLLIFVHPADAEGLYPAEGALTPLSAIMGFGVGLVLEGAWVRFSVRGEWWRRILRFAVGLVVVGILYAGPKLILPEELPHAVEALSRFLRYGLLGWAVAFLCPWLFLRLRLAERETRSFGPG
jgi:hypothetical protein